MADGDWGGSLGGDNGLMCTAGQPGGLVNTMMWSPNAVAIALLNNVRNVGGGLGDGSGFTLGAAPSIGMATADNAAGASNPAQAIGNAAAQQNAPAGAAPADGFARYRYMLDGQGTSSQQLPFDDHLPGLDTFYGTRHDTTYVPAGYEHFPTADGKPVFYTYDDEGQPFFVANGEIRNIPIPYARPSLQTLQQGDHPGGFFDGMDADIAQSWSNLKTTMGRRYDDLGLLGTIVVTGLEGANTPFATVGQIGSGTVDTANNAYRGEWYNAGHSAGTAAEGLTSAALMAYGPKVISAAGEAAAPYLSRITAPIAAAGAPVVRGVNAELDWLSNAGYNAADAVMGRGAAPWQESVFGVNGRATVGSTSDPDFASLQCTATGGANAPNAAYSVRSVGSPLRASRLNILTPEQIDLVTNEWIPLGGDPSVLRFNQPGMQTGYAQESGNVFVNGDVFPTTSGSMNQTANLSVRETLAHEMGHMAHPNTDLPIGAWNDEFRASYWASKNVPSLTLEEQRNLAIDAWQRALDAGQPVKMNPYLRQMIYGF